MRRLSFTGTWGVKYAVIPLCGAIFILFESVALFGSEKDRSVTIAVLAAVWFAFVLAQAIWAIRNLADRVDDAGDALVVSKHGIDARIPLSTVQAVVRKPMMKHVELRVEPASSLGGVIKFVPVGALLGPNPILDQLEARAHRARTEAHR